MKVAITGANGFIGSALPPVLRADGHDILRLVRREARAADESRWDPDHLELDPTLLSDVDAVIHLAGVGVGDKRWSPAYKKLLMDSRVNGTTAVSEALASAAADGRRRVLLSGSAVGWYGDTGPSPVDESASAGTGFLADLVRQWEKSTAGAAEAGVRVVRMRTGLVCGRHGGMMDRLLPLFAAGIGGPMGSGRQYWPWISLPDELAAIRFLLTAKDISGPVNLTGPTPVTNAKFSHALGRALRRPAFVPAPGFALRLLLGEFADEGVLASQRALPKKLLDAGFSFQHADVDAALRWVADQA